MNEPTNDALGHDLPRGNTTDTSQFNQINIASDEVSASAHRPVRNNPSGSEVTPPNDMARHDRSVHDKIGPDVIGHDNARQDTPRRDDDHASDDAAPTEPVASEEETEPISSDWIELDETVQLLKVKGILRSVRTIQRYCQKGKLVCSLTPTETAARYLVKKSSIFDFVDHHNNMMPSREIPLFNQSEDRDLERPSQASNPSDPISDSPSFDTELNKQIVTLKDQQIEILSSQLNVANKQLEMKDEQITSLLERDHETNVLLHNLQKHISLPSGKEPSHQPNQPYDIHPDQTPLNG